MSRVIVPIIYFYFQMKNKIKVTVFCYLGCLESHQMFFTEKLFLYWYFESLLRFVMYTMDLIEVWSIFFSLANSKHSTASPRHNIVVYNSLVSQQQMIYKDNMWFIVSQKFHSPAHFYELPQSVTWKYNLSWAVFFPEQIITARDSILSHFGRKTFWIEPRFTWVQGI